MSDEESVVSAVGAVLPDRTREVGRIPLIIVGCLPIHIIERHAQVVVRADLVIEFAQVDVLVTVSGLGTDTAEDVIDGCLTLRRSDSRDDRGRAIGQEWIRQPGWWHWTVRYR